MTRPRSLLLILAALLLVGLAAAGWFAGRSAPTHAVVREALTETVIASGRIITPERVEVGAELLGSMAEVRVEAGDRVAAGQVLGRIDAGDLNAAAEQARRAVDEADARLVQLRQVAMPVADQALAQADANLAQAEAEFERVRQLAQAGFYNQSRLDEAQRAREAARAGREAARVQATGVGPEGVESRLAEARRAQAKAALAVAAAKSDKALVRAPAAALVLRKLVEPGDIVTSGRPLFELAVDGETQVLLLVDEKNLGRLAVGQSAGLLADAYPDRPFAGEIFHIAPAVDPLKGSVEIKLRVAEPPAFLRPDMTVSAEIRVGHKAEALTLPSEAIRDAAGQPWVLAIADGRAVRRPVGLGLRGSGRVEVATGIKAGERVIPPSAGVEPGQRVRVKD